MKRWAVGTAIVLVALAALTGSALLVERAAQIRIIPRPIDAFYKACIDHFNGGAYSISGYDLRPGSGRLNGKPFVTHYGTDTAYVGAALRTGGSFHCTVTRRNGRFTITTESLD